MHAELFHRTPPRGRRREGPADPRMAYTTLAYLKACVDRADQTTRIYTQKYAKIRQNSCAHYFKGIELCRLIAKINTRFQPDAPRGVHLLKTSHGTHFTRETLAY